MAENKYDELSKGDLVDEIKKRNGDKTSGDENYIPVTGDKDTLKSRLEDDDKGVNDNANAEGAKTGADATPDDEKHDESDSGKDGTPTAGTGGGASVQPGAADEDEDLEPSDAAGDPATAELTQLQLNEQHGGGEELAEQSKEIQDSLDERRDEAKSAVSTISNDDAKALFDANVGVPKWRKNTEDLTDEEKESPSDYPTPTGDGAQEYSEEHQEAADREREQKNASLPKFDEREEFDDEVPPNEKLLDRIGESGRGDTIRSDEDDAPDYVAGEQHVYEAPDDTTWREIATLLGLPRPAEIAFLNGRYDGTEYVAKGTKVLLPTGYDYQ